MTVIEHICYKCQKVLTGEEAFIDTSADPGNAKLWRAACWEHLSYADKKQIEKQRREEDYRLIPVEARIIAAKFHEAYETYAPDAGWETNHRSRVPWTQVPIENKLLMARTVHSLLLASVIEAVPMPLWQQLPEKHKLDQDFSWHLLWPKSWTCGFCKAHFDNPADQKRHLDGPMCVGWEDNTHRKPLLKRVAERLFGK